VAKALRAICLREVVEGPGNVRKTQFQQVGAAPETDLDVPGDSKNRPGTTSVE
jgi:hypothetical protein